ncbi:sugar transferase [Ekhidna sp.]|uniref:sugar transferase n=1 Tax=Ekhidna sp. TaxID=2608089 RepID=UPI003B50AF7C
MVKPLGDWIIALLLFTLLSPILVLLSLIISIHFRSSPFFVQERVGRQTQIFKLIKLKTLKVKDDESTSTPLSKLIRSLSLDELPQLLNVLKGEMSIIGPRPLLVEYIPFYNIEEQKRHLVKPGITGWAQVNGRNTIDWSSRMSLDIYYVQNVSFLLDCKILLRSIFEVIRRDKTVYKNEPTVKFSEYASKR